jgi:pimeloyl-ACP methyl ester carboxylesterase
MRILEFPMMRKVLFPSLKNHRLCGILSTPSADKSCPLVVLCHGFSTSKDGRTYAGLEERLNQGSVSTFRFDFFGHGESEGEFEDITISKAVGDVLGAIRYVKEFGYKKIGLMGSSFGGFASIVSAGQSKDLFVLDLKSPVSDYLGLLIARDLKLDVDAWRKNGSISFEGAEGDQRRLNFSFYEDAERYDGYSYARRIEVPTLIVHGDRDETVPLEQSEKTAALIPSCHLEILKGADHIYSNPKHFERMLDLLTKFLLQKSFP